MVKHIVLLSFAVFLAGCSSSDDPVQPVQSQEIRLSVSILNAQTMNYDVSLVEAKLVSASKSQKTPVVGPVVLDKSTTTVEMTIDGQEATAVIADLQAGNYEISVNIYSGIPVIARGAQNITLAAGATDSVAFTAIEWDSLFPDSPHHILFVGNSLTYLNGGLGGHMAPFVLSADPHMQTASDEITRGGYTLANHWTSESTNTREAIASGVYDWVVLQGSPSNMVNIPESYEQYAPLFINDITSQNQQAALFIPPSYRDFPQHAETLADLCESVMADNPVTPIPINQTWYRVITDRPDIELFHEDGTHPSVHGTYLYLCVAYSALYQRSPEGTQYVISSDISEADRDYLQAIAWEVTSEYQGWNDNQ